MKPSLFLFSFFIAASALANYGDAITQRLADPLFHQGLVNEYNYSILNDLSRNYAKRNSLNVGWLSVFRSYNSSETLQNRTALENHRSERTLIFDMDGTTPVDWSQVRIDENNDPNLSGSQYTLSLDTINITKKDSPIFLLLLSNQHVINDYLSNNAHKEIAKMGITLAVLEYPGYGVSLGIGTKQNWMQATANAVTFLNELTSKKIYILGHSIGGPLALESATMPEIQKKVAGAISYGGFTNLYDQSKNQLTNPIIRAMSRPISWLTARKNNIDGIRGLETMAKENIPALVLHGEHDGAVAPKNLNKYESLMAPLRKKYPKATLETTLFKGLYHEEVNNYNAHAHEDFYRVWNRIQSFVRKTSRN